MSQPSQHFLSGLNYQTLGSLGEVTSVAIRDNAALLEQIIDRQEKQKAKKEGDLLTFDDIDRLYNAGITDDEKKAWVWYKRSLGYPMKGWEKYFLKSKSNQSDTLSEVITTIEDAVVKDNRWEDITTVPKGTILGKPTKYKQEYRGIVWWVFVAEDGAKRFVDESKVKLSKSSVQADQNEMDALVKKFCLFYSDGQYLPYPIYAYGNMYDRTLQLNRDTDYIISTFGQSVYDVHKAVIDQSKPRMLSVQNTDPRERPRILAISDFARAKMKNDNFKITELREESGVDIQGATKDKLNELKYKRSREAQSYSSYWAKVKTDEGLYPYSLNGAFRLWLRSLDKNDIDEVSASQIIEYYLDAANYSKDLTESQVDTLQKYCPSEGERLFSKFLNEALTFSDQQKLDFLWNRLYNAYSSIPYHKVPVGFTCSAYFKSSLLEIAPAQREAIAFMEIAGSGIVAYDVGVGKTMSAIVTLTNALYSQKAKRALVVVPNPTYKKWKKEIAGATDSETGEFVNGVLSYTNVKMYDWYNMGVERVKNQSGTIYINGHNSDKMVDANSITMVTYEGLAKMGYSNKLMGNLFESLVNILEQTEDNKKSLRDLEKRNQKYRAMLGKGNKGTICDIDTLGYDYIVIDEAHNFKNIFESVPADEDGNKRYKIESATSDRAVKAFFLCNYIQRTYGANVCLLTATPFTNSPLEIFSMMSLVGYDSMKKMGIYNLQQFMQMFVQQSYEYVNSYDGTIKQAPVVKSYNNRLILQRLLYNHITYKTGEEVGVKRPIKINLPKVNELKNGKVVRLPQKEQILTYLRPTAVQQMYQSSIEALAKKGGRDAIANIGKALGKNLDNALSPYLVSGSPEDAADFVNASPKIKYVMECIDSVKKWHESKGEECSGQVIYMNRGKEYFPFIKDYLQKYIKFKKGVKFDGKTFDEVEIISSGISQERKEAIKDAFLANVVKVIIGTATIREGIDLQTHGTCLYLCTVDWNPTDVKQVEGRIWRQGNSYGYVRVVIPLLQDSMDVFVFQKLEEKTARINDIWYKSDRGNVLDQESLDPEEIKFALFSDVQELARIKLETKAKEILRRFENVTGNLKVLEEFNATLKAFQNIKAYLISDTIQKSEVVFREFLRVYDTEILRNYNFREMSAEARKTFKETVQKHIDDLAVLQQQPQYDDKDLLKKADKTLTIYQKINGDNGYYYRWSNTISSYRELLSKVKKTEKTVLEPKGYSVNDDILKIVNDYKEDLDVIQREINYLKSAEGREEVTKEVKEAKERFAVTGKNPEEQAKGFQSLNYLLAYKAGQTTENYTPFRGNLLPPVAPVNTDKKAKRKRKIEIEAEALILILKLKTKK